MPPSPRLRRVDALVLMALLGAGFSPRDAAAFAHQARFDAAARSVEARAGRPEAIAPLAELVRLDDAVAPGALAKALRRVVDDPRTDPLVAAQAAHRLALEEERAGRDGEAHRLAQQLGLLDTYRIVGPFDAQGRSGFARSYGPEEAAPAPQAGGRFPGKEREVGWRLAAGAGAVRRGALLLDGLLRPDSDAVAYALAYVESPRSGPAVLRLGSPGPTKVWVNGRLVIARDVARGAALDQDAAPVRLEAGTNLVLVKTVVASGAWRLYVRLTDSRGRALRGVRAIETPAQPIAAWRRPRPGSEDVVATGKARTLLSELARRTRSAPEGAARAGAWLDHARALALLRAEDEDEKPIEAALEAALRAGGGLEASVLLGELGVDDDKRRAAFERVAAGPAPEAERALALVGLGEIARGKRREGPAVAAWREALAIDPGCWPAALALAAEEESAGLSVSALARLDALPEEARALPRVRRARVRALEALGRRAEAEAERRALLALAPGDFDAIVDLAAALRARGAITEAATLYDRAAARRPELVFVTLEAAQLREGIGDTEGARRVLEAAAARAPDEPRLHEALGKLLARRGDGAAVASLRRALELRPQNPSLRRFVDRLQGETSPAGGRAAAADDLARVHAEEGEALARGALLGAPANARTKEAAVILLEKQVVHVHRNGLSETFAQRLVHVGTERGARDNQEFYVRYTPGNQEVEIRRARIFRKAAGGALEISEATARDDRDLSEPWYGLYYDNRAEVVVFEGLRAGDVLEVQYTLADVSPENAMADYFGDLTYIADALPKRRWEYKLIGPQGRSFFFNEPRLPGLERTVERRAGEVVYTFSAKDVAKLNTEPSMPGWGEVAPYLHVSTYSSWGDVGRWYWNLVRDQLTPDEALRKAARNVTARLATEDEKIRALHSFVIEGTRYVGLEFGIHGFKPYRVSQVLARRFGDCKDKASLLVALLKEVGIEAELVLLRTRRGGRVDPAPASLAVFDHAVTYIPSRGLYIDGTAEFSGVRELPYEDQGVMVLRVGPRGAVLAETPVLPSSENRAARSWVVEVEPSGRARVEETVTLGGQAAPEWRQHYQTPGERAERYGKVWSGRFPGAAVEALAIDGAEDRHRPLQVKATVDVPRLGEVIDEGRLSLPTTSREGELVRSYARLSRRTHELLLAYPWQHEEVLTFRLPSGWRVERAPQPLVREEPFGRFVLDVETLDDGKAISIRAAVDVTRHRIAPGEYGSFRRFLGSIDGALAQRLVLRRGEP